MKAQMTHWQFNVICVEHLVSPALVWKNEAFRDLVNNDKLTEDNLRKVIQEQFYETD
mgnify:FL=1